MATVDLTTTNSKPIGHAFQQPVEWVRYRLSWADDLTGSAGDTYQIHDLPAEYALVAGRIVVTTVFASASSGTMQVKVGSAVLGAAVSTNAIAKGIVIDLSPNDTEDTVGSALYVSSDDTIDLVTATAEPATGEFDLYLGIQRVIDNT